MWSKELDRASQPLEAYPKICINIGLQGKLNTDATAPVRITFSTRLAGEIFIEFDADLRRDKPSDSLLVMTYNRSFLGYVATALVFDEGSYETMRGTLK